MTAVKATKAPVAPASKKGSAGTDALAKAREARERASGLDVFKFSGQVKEGVKKLPPQAEQIVKIVESHKKSGVTRESLVREMDGVVQTKQPQGRILAYYQKRLVDEGHVTITEAPRKAAASQKSADDEGEEAEDE